MASLKLISNHEALNSFSFPKELRTKTYSEKPYAIHLKHCVGSIACTRRSAALKPQTVFH